MLQNVAGGQIKGLCRVLKDRGRYPDQNVFVLSSDDGLREIADGPATEVAFFKRLDDLANCVARNEQLLIVFACHMQKGSLIDDQISYKDLDDRLTRFPTGTEIAVLIEGCYSGAALPVLEHADVVYAAGTADQPTWGGFLNFWVDALGRNDEAYQTADLDADGRVSLGEAYDYAADSDRLSKLYRGLPKDVWPTTMVPTPMRRVRSDRMDYQMWLLPLPPASDQAQPAPQAR